MGSRVVNGKTIVKQAHVEHSRGAYSTMLRHGTCFIISYHFLAVLDINNQMTATANCISRQQITSAVLTYQIQVW